MENKIRYYVENLFSQAPKTEQSIDTREEMISNLLAKYKDLLSTGLSEEEAYKKTIDEIGDISEIIKSLGGNKPIVRQKAVSKAVQGSVHGLIWFIALIIYFAISILTGAWHITWILFLITPAVTSVVDGFFRISEGKNAKGRFIGAMWLMITALYFIISFGTFAWHITWIIFLIGGAFTQIINLLYSSINGGKAE